MSNLNTTQRQFIYDTIVNYKDSYGKVGLHIKSLEGMHIAAPRTKGNSFYRTLEYIRTINKVLKQTCGDRAPQLMMDAVGNQRVKWVLAETNDSNDNA